MTMKEKQLAPGGKKGGAVFPRFSLESAIAAAKRLASKSHSGPVAKDIYFSGVLQVSGPRAEVKSSSMKQYGFLAGSSKAGFSASPLAKLIATAEGDDYTAALQKAALSPKVFKGIFDAFHGDAITKTRLRQRASELNVHPDVLDICVKNYVESLSLAGLVRVEGDQVSHSQIPAQKAAGDQDADVETPPSEGETTEINASPDKQSETVAAQGKPPQMAKALINVTINVDSSLDTDKLAKQLELLKKYGAL